MQRQQQERWSMQPHQQKRRRISMMSASGDCLPQQGMSPLRGGRLYPWRMYQFNGAMRNGADEWTQWCELIDQSRGISHSIYGWNAMTDGPWWCGKCARSHSKLNRSIRVGTYSTRKNDWRKAGWRAPKKHKSEKKNPLVPRYILRTYHYIRERHIDKSAWLANIWFQKGYI